MLFPTCLSMAVIAGHLALLTFLPSLAVGPCWVLGTCAARSITVHHRMVTALVAEHPGHEQSSKPFTLTLTLRTGPTIGLDTALQLVRKFPNTAH